VCAQRNARARARDALLIIDLFMSISGGAPAVAGRTPIYQGSCVNPTGATPGGTGVWLRFESLRDLCASPSWAAYVAGVYGELPTTSSFPFCTSDFWHINKTVFDQAHITSAPPQITDRLQRSYDDSFLHGKRPVEWQEGEFFQKQSKYPISYYHSQWAIYHDLRPYAESNQWIEVTHRSKGLGITEARGAGMWFSYARGSGIWFFTGRHRLFDSHRQAAQLLCSRWKHRRTAILLSLEQSLTRCARTAGLDSISFRTSRPDPPNASCIYNFEHCRQHVTTTGTMSTWGHVGLYELMSVHMVGSFACGNESGGILPYVRSGWKASRPCDCDPAASVWLNCRKPPIAASQGMAACGEGRGVVGVVGGG
jgi:hypothetical protein